MGRIVCIYCIRDDNVHVVILIYVSILIETTMQKVLFVLPMVEIGIEVYENLAPSYFDVTMVCIFSFVDIITKETNKIKVFDDVPIVGVDWHVPVVLNSSNAVHDMVSFIDVNMVIVLLSENLPRKVLKGIVNVDFDVKVLAIYVSFDFNVVNVCIIVGNIHNFLAEAARIRIDVDIILKVDSINISVMDVDTISVLDDGTADTFPVNILNSFVMGIVNNIYFTRTHGF